MEFRDLEVFIAVIRTGNFTRAAEQSYVSQPAVSLAIRRLEDELGTELVDRGRGRATPTHAGRLLLREATEILSRRDAVLWEIGRWEGLESGELRLGTTDAVSAYLLPEVYREFRARYAAVAFRVSVDASAVLSRRLLDGELDLAVLTLPAPISGLDTRPVREERLVLVCAPAHPAASRKRLRPSQLAEHGMIGYPGQSVTRRVIDTALRARGVEPHVDMEMGAPEAMKRLAEVGLGWSVLPEQLVLGSIEAGSLTELELSGFDVRRTLGFALPAGRPPSPAAAAFMELAFEQLGEAPRRADEADDSQNATSPGSRARKPNP